jgi:hypothetical protein
MGIVFVYLKDGKITVKDLHSNQHEKLIRDGWKHTATLDAASWIENLYNSVPDNELRETINSLSKL